jgi:hypothetical protein
MRSLRPLVLIFPAIGLAAIGCTDDANTVSTGSNTVATDTIPEDATSTTSLDASTTTKAEGSDSTTAPSVPQVTADGSAEPDGLDPAIQAWVHSFCASAQQTLVTFGPDDVGDTRPVWPEKAAAAADLHDLYQELADIIESGIDLTGGEFHDRSERAVRDLTAVANEYLAMETAIEAEPVGDELEAIIDHHYQVEEDALRALGLFLATPDELGYDVWGEFTDTNGDLLDTNTGCPFNLAYYIP